MRPLLLAALLVVIRLVPAAAQVPPVVDGPRPEARVVDETGSLSGAERAEIERLAESIRATTRADLVVVVIPTTDGVPPRRFATDLFNRWRLGNADRDDGLLLFVALADRKSEIILGDGLDTPATRAAAQRIMEGTMIPQFRAGRPGRALLDGATRAVTDIVGVPAEAPAAADTPPIPAATGGTLVEKRPEPILDPPLDAATAVEERDAGVGAPPPGTMPAERPVPAPFVPEWTPPSPPWGHGQVQRRTEPYDPAAGLFLLVGGGGATLVGGSWALSHLWRYRRRHCRQCGTEMILLGETEDDARLERRERVEESLGSVDYDVWSCPVCPEVEKVRYGAMFTRYAKCPRCRAVTKSQTVSRLRSPTQYREGLERIDERCVHCGWERTSERVIPRLPEPSRVDWSSGSSGGGFSGSSFGGGSSGSSGGHSSGGGASGSW